MSEPTGQPQEGWPLPWIAASIAVFVIGYTFISLEYRKANRPYEPYSDLKERGQTHTLLNAGYQRIPLTVEVPPTGTPNVSGDTARIAPAGVPPYLAKLLFDQPQLPAAYTDLQASTQTRAGEPYFIEFRCQPDVSRKYPREAAAYVHAATIVIVPDCTDGDEPVPGSTTKMGLTIQAGELKPGNYHVRLIGAQSSLGWPLQVN